MTASETADAAHGAWHYEALVVWPHPKQSRNALASLLRRGGTHQMGKDGQVGHINDFSRERHAQDSPGHGPNLTMPHCCNTIALGTECKKDEAAGYGRRTRGCGTDCIKQESHWGHQRPSTCRWRSSRVNIDCNLSARAFERARPRSALWEYLLGDDAMRRAGPRKAPRRLKHVPRGQRIIAAAGRATGAWQRLIFQPFGITAPLWWELVHVAVTRPGEETSGLGGTSEF